MPKKVNVNQLVDEMAQIKVNIAQYEVLLDSKKRIMQKYFEKYGEETVQTEHASVFVQSRANVQYDIAKLQEKLPKKLLNAFVEKEYSITDWNGLVKLLVEHGIAPEEVKPYIEVTRKVNPEKLSRLYEEEKVQLEELKGCYTATVHKSIALRLKEQEGESPDAFKFK